MLSLGTLGAEQSFTIKIDDNTADVPVNVQFAASNPTTGAENATDPAFVMSWWMHQVIKKSLVKKL